ncbi:MAG: hypothetical protein LUD27_06700 [Clostridia bacterium]|nr:hypothetical protein [Clostridia bacterium]
MYETDTVATTPLYKNVTITISGNVALTSTAEDATEGDYYSVNDIVTDNRS